MTPIIDALGKKFGKDFIRPFFECGEVDFFDFQFDELVRHYQISKVCLKSFDRVKVMNLPSLIDVKIMHEMIRQVITDDCSVLVIEDAGEEIHLKDNSFMMFVSIHFEIGSKKGLKGKKLLDYINSEIKRFKNVCKHLVKDFEQQYGKSYDQAPVH